MQFFGSWHCHSFIPGYYLVGRLRVTSSTLLGRRNWRSVMIPGVGWRCSAAVRLGAVDSGWPGVLQGGIIRTFVGGVSAAAGWDRPAAGRHGLNPGYYWCSSFRCLTWPARRAEKILRAAEFDDWNNHWAGCANDLFNCGSGSRQWLFHPTCW